jgi:hypothetical protein
LHDLRIKAPDFLNRGKLEHSDRSVVANALICLARSPGFPVQLAVGKTFDYPRREFHAEFRRNGYGEFGVSGTGNDFEHDITMGGRVIW